METPKLINIVDPDTQEIGSIPVAQLQDAKAQGYTEAAPEEVHKALNEQQFGTPAQQALTGLEGAGSALTFGATPALEVGLGLTTPENIAARRETNPVAHGVGEIGSLVGSSLLGVGEGALLAKAGEAAAGAAGLGEATTLAKIGSAAVRGATENALFQAGSEAEKFVTDPGQSLESAAMQVGLMGVMGGGIGAGLGAISPLWRATAGSKVDQILKAITDRAGGIDGVVPDAMNDAISKSGMEIAPEVRAGLSDNPQFQQMFKTLEQSDTTKSGLELQDSYKNFRKQADEALIQSFGKTTDTIPAEISKYEAGKDLGETLASELHEKVGPLSERFEALREKYKGLELPGGEIIPEQTNLYGDVVSKATKLPGFTDQLADRIAGLAEQQDWTATPNSETMGQINKVLQALPKKKTLSQLTELITKVGDDTYSIFNPQLSRNGMLIKDILKDAEMDLVLRKLGEEGPELVAEHSRLRSEWKAASALKDSLNDRLHIKGGDSATSFIKDLKLTASESGEKIFQRLSGKNDAALLELLQREFPKTAEKLKQFHLDQLLSNASKKAKAGEAINARALLKEVQNMSPELRQFAIHPDTLQKTEAVGALLDKFDQLPHNFSNTARTMDKLSQYIPGSAMAILTMITTHNPALSFVMGPLVKYLGKDVPDAIRLSLLKFMGSNKPIEAEGFKAMVDVIHQAMQGEGLLNKSAKAIFSAGKEVIPSKLIPSDSTREKLDKKLGQLQVDPSPLFDIGGKMGHYLPEHSTAAGQFSANAMNYLNSLRPVPNQKSPLDTKMKPSAAETAAYHRQLDIAQQPLMVMKHLHDGTLNSQDVTTLKVVYPNLYNRMSQKLSDQMIESVHKEETIPYQVRLSLSKMLGQPLDSTMTAEGLQAHQMSFHQPSQSQQSQAPAPKHSSSALNKMSAAYQTPGQAREAYRGK